MKAIILAGGFGTRLRSITNDTIPKCMVDVMGKPIIHYVVHELKKQGITDITLALHYKAEQFMDFCNKESIKYKIENEPFGTGGAIKNCVKGNDPVLVVNGDTIAGIDYNDMLSCHKTQVTIAVDKNGTHAGIYIIEPSLFKKFTKKSFSFEKDVLQYVTFSRYQIPWFTDVGTPEGYEKGTKWLSA